MSLIGFVMLYMAVSIGIGLYAATRVKTTQDYALAGRSLPLAMVITATFATWFGSETVLGLPGRFIEGGIAGVIEEPFGSGMALILVGAFFAGKLYKMNLLTIGSFYRHRYGKGVELACSIFIILSYLGWVAAQVSALGLVLNLVTEGAISVTLGMVIGTLVVLLYTMYGGMWSVALTDFFQMILIVVGLVVIAFVAGDMAGGADKVITYANNRHLFHALPEMSVHGWLFWISAAMTMMIGSIPQQDVFQRVMSAKSGKIAVAGPIIGGVFYIFFAMVPMFIVVASILVMPDVSGRMLAEDPQQLLPTMIRDYMPMWLRVLFFGAVLSAVMSTASATILAPSTTFVENGQGDVLVAWENEAYLSMRDNPEDYEIVNPSISILAQPSVAVVDDVVDDRGTRDVATEYLQYLYSDAAQRIAAKHYYRPANSEILKEYADVFDLNIDLVSIQDFGGWDEAQKVHFSDGGIFDQIYEK